MSAGIEPFPVRTGQHRYRLAAPPGDYIGDAVRRSGKPYEEDLLAAVRPLIRAGATVLDIGANIGNHTIFFAIVCGARVHAFEPNPQALHYLRANVALNERIDSVIIHGSALSDHAGRATLVDGGDSGLATKRTVDDAAGSVLLHTLDELDLVEEPIALVKLDVEGSECAVLAGARTTLARWRPVVVAEVKDKDAGTEIERVLATLDYRRFPLQFAWTPTYVYLPDWRRGFRLAAQPRLWQRVLSQRIFGPRA